MTESPHEKFPRGKVYARVSLNREKKKTERKKFSVNTNTHSTQRKKIWSIDSVGCSPPKTKGKNPLELLSSPPLVAAVLIAQEGAV